MKKTAIANVYNFIRVSHVEPSRFILDDYETIKNQIITNKQYKIPGSYALKHDALIEPRYQELFKTYLDDNDEISAWWEITEDLCQRAGVIFPKKHQNDELFDERVDSAYSMGYAPEDRKKLVDAYMKDFYAAFNHYPKIIGSWVLDEVTLAYAQENYGIIAAAICRDQMGTDGFTLWGGYPNGIYIPSKDNINTPANSKENALDIAVFRLLSPDPIYSFEADVRDDLFGVYTLEPSWLAGRNERIDWFFDRITKEDFIGDSYTMVGQENNFLWENINPGYIPQIQSLKKRQEKDEIKIVTMEDSARYFLAKYQVTPPATFQATTDWDKEKNLQALWYASRYYRAGFLIEENKLRIRDLFIYTDHYESRYLHTAMSDTRSIMDATPLLFPQIWRDDFKQRPYIKFLDEKGNEQEAKISMKALDAMTYLIEMAEHDIQIILKEDRIKVKGNTSMLFEYLPLITSNTDKTVFLSYRGFDYAFKLDKGSIVRKSDTSLLLVPEENEIILNLSSLGQDESIYQPAYLQNPDRAEQYLRPKLKTFTDITIPLPKPILVPGPSVFELGTSHELNIHSEQNVYVSLNGEDYVLYTEPLTINKPCEIKAYSISGEQKSEVVSAQYHFTVKNFSIHSKTKFDERPIFNRNGINDLLETKRASLDYIDGRWLGSTEDIIFDLTFDHETHVNHVTMGFLSAHRSGIIFPKSIQITVNDNQTYRLDMPTQAQAHEIVKKDFSIAIKQEVKTMHVKVARHALMPQWCIYKGDSHVFTMMDNLIIE